MTTAEPDRWEAPVGTAPRRAGRPAGPPPRSRRLLRKVRAAVGLIVIALGLGLALAAGLGTIFWAISSALHHAATS